ncbi:hypothetical protein A6R68_06870, partial [Neotoma lepida]
PTLVLLQTCPSAAEDEYILGYHIIKPDVIIKLEQGDEPWIREGGFSPQSCPDEIWQENGLMEKVRGNEKKQSRSTVFNYKSMVEKTGDVASKAINVERTLVPSRKVIPKCDSCEKSLACVSEFISSDGSYAQMKPDVCAGCGKSLLHVKLEKTHPGDDGSYEFSQNEDDYTLSEENIYQKIRILEKPFEYVECQKSFPKNTKGEKIRKEMGLAE